MTVNVKNFKDKSTMYLYFFNILLDGSGYCELGITEDAEKAAMHGRFGKVFKVVLEEHPIKVRTITETINKEEKYIE